MFFEVQVFFYITPGYMVFFFTSFRNTFSVYRVARYRFPKNRFLINRLSIPYFTGLAITYFAGCRPTRPAKSHIILIPSHQPQIITTATTGCVKPCPNDNERGKSIRFAKQGFINGTEPSICSAARTYNAPYTLMRDAYVEHTPVLMHIKAAAIYNAISL